MTFTRFTDPHVFEAIVRDVLVEYEAENNLPLGIISGISTGGRSHDDPLLAIAHTGSVPDAASICAVVVRTPPFPVVIAYTDHAGDRATIGCVNDSLRSIYNDEIGGFNADGTFVDDYVSSWFRLTGSRMDVYMETLIYKCVAPVIPESVVGGARPMSAKDADVVRAFVAGFYQEAVPDEFDEERVDSYVRRMVIADASQEGVFLWEAEGSVVSMAAFTGSTPHGIRINAVYTPPEHRRHGYASACVAELTQRLLQSGREFCFLFTDQSNPTSNRIYQEIGYTVVSENRVWRTA